MNMQHYLSLISRKQVGHLFHDKTNDDKKKLLLELLPESYYLCNKRRFDDDCHEDLPFTCFVSSRSSVRMLSCKCTLSSLKQVKQHFQVHMLKLSLSSQNVDSFRVESSLDSLDKRTLHSETEKHTRQEGKLIMDILLPSGVQEQSFMLFFRSDQG